VAVVLLAPAVAWLLWVSWSGAEAADATAIAWFLTVAAGCVLAGALARPHRWIFVGLWVLADVAALVTLYLWWSSSDVTGLFMIGILLSVIPIVVVTPLLLLAGTRLGVVRGDGAR
jgi:hypothetical protein